ncbi:hypothetical protein C8J55DRAFT_605742 [Lentinula edodes]|uniref:Uncharacterized protein n=1 Tax=Lentinula lateritia TaxID=40482 RepID=A0A9W9DQS8_9AGAR|nr:hypothetical protein C8J55DRAFT_605742 [Lentinula edodes]
MNNHIQNARDIDSSNYCLPCSGVVTPLKPRIRPVVPLSAMSPVELLPSQASTIPTISDRSLNLHNKFPCAGPDISPLADDLKFSTLSLASPTVKVLPSNQDSDLHVGSTCSLSEAIDTPPLRTPFHPSSPSSPNAPVRIDWSAFPVFDATAGPTISDTSLKRPLFCKSRPMLSRGGSFDALAVYPPRSPADESPDISPCIPSRKAVRLRRSTIYRPLNMVKSPCHRLSSVQETSTLSQWQTEEISRPVQSSSQSVRLLARCSNNLQKRSTASLVVDDDYDSNDRRSKPSRPPLVTGFLQNLPPFRLSATPSATSPISTSPATPSRCAAPLRSPFFIRKRDEIQSGLK